MDTELAGTTTELVYNIGYSVTGAEPVNVPYTRSGQRYVPSYVAIKFRSWRSAADTPDNGTFFVQAHDLADLKFEQVTITGPKLLKSGSPSQNSTREMFYRLEAAPDWVRSLVEKARLEMLTNA